AASDTVAVIATIVSRAWRASVGYDGMLSMSKSLSERQHAVNDRTPAGEAFNALLVQVIELNRHFTTAAEALTRPAGQSLARWLVLAECREAPTTVAQIARQLRLARQSVQRVADLLVHDGLGAYEDNPRHRRAKLLALTPRGLAVLARIDAAQREWADAQGAAIGEAPLRAAGRALEPVLGAL